MKQNTPEWLEMRKNYLGASDAPVLMGFHKWRTPYKLWEEKLGLNNGSADNSAMAYGRKMEAPALEKYQELTGIEVGPDIVYHPTKKYMMASLDGLSEDQKCAVEIKNVCLEDHLVAKGGKVPDKYYPQVQHQMACLGLDQMHYFSMNKGDTALVEVKMCNDYIGKLYEVEENFWNKVINLEEPELVAEDFAKRDAEWLKMAAELYDIKKSISSLKKKEIELSSVLKKLSKGKSSMSDNFYYRKSLSKGPINYKIIPELENVNTDKYRNPSQERWTLSKKN